MYQVLIPPKTVNAFRAPHPNPKYPILPVTHCALSTRGISGKRVLGAIYEKRGLGSPDKNAHLEILRSPSMSFLV